MDQTQAIWIRDPLSILADGAERASAIAAPTLDAVKDIVGFVRRGRTSRPV